MNVERVTEKVDYYPTADEWEVEEGVLTLSNSGGCIVTYASGTWVRVYTPDAEPES